MQFRVWHKLFLAIFATSLLLVALTLLLTRYSFERGFVDYLNSLDTNRSQALIEALQEYHLEDPGWQQLPGNLSIWNGLLHDHWYGPPPGLSEGRIPPPKDDSQPKRAKGPMGSMGGPPQLSPPEPDTSRRGANLTLLGKNGQFISGIKEQSGYELELPIRENNQRIGTLLITRSTEVQESYTEADNQFLRQQQGSLRTIALFATLFAISVSWLLSKILLKPLQALSRATQKFADGDFTSRVKVKRNDELGGVITDFNEMATKLEKNREARRQWTADISHELRTPLTILRGEIQALSDGVRPMNQESVSSLDTEIKRLHNLVDDLYDLSLADAGSMSYKKIKVDWRDVVEECVEHFKTDALDKNLALKLQLPDKPVNTHIDPDRMAQLVVNLLKNSIRYTDSPGEILVEMTSKKRLATLSISDSSPSVSPEDIPKIFKRLYRTEDSRNRNSGGAGLGLPICKKIAEAHNGTLKAEPSSLGGLKMILEIDLA